jgi:predicted nucleic acid-binding protein
VITINYLDASAIIKLLIIEEGSALIKKYFSEKSNFYTTSLCLGEALGVLKRKRFFERTPITEEEYLAAADYLLAMIHDQVILVEEIEISDHNTFSQIESLVRKYSLDISDVFQIVTIKEGAFSKGCGLDSLLLITGDGDLGKASTSEGLRVWNCMVDPMPL